MDSADLHIHSSKSDGLLSPVEIVDWSFKRGLKCISITDHDNVDAIKEVLPYAGDRGVELVPGVELSTDYNDIEVHILGYFIEYDSNLLNDFLKKLYESRYLRAEDMVRKLNRLGYHIKFQDVLDTAEDAVSIGRPHIARVLVKMGVCVSVSDAFEKYIGFGKPAYVERYKVSPFEAVEMISKCDGVSCIAHPGLISNINVESLVKKLVEWGLTGIEVYHTKHNKEVAEYYSHIADKYKLVPTGGSDCHGALYGNEPILGSVTVPYNNVLMLKERLR